MQIGQTLRNRYRILQVIGGGGFASTYLAEDLDVPVTPKPKCVIKRLHPQTTNAEVIRLFQQEAEILYKLGQLHDQLPKVFAYFEEDGKFYLVQDFIDGFDLSREMMRGERWSEPKTIQLLLEILEILDFVHSQNIIHRDLKPSNLMRRHQDRKLVLIDFGAVKQFHQAQVDSQGKTNLTVAIGTPGYMPDEQANGKPKLASDIYAVGAIAIQALTGVEPNSLPEDANGEMIWRDRATVSDEFAEVLTKMIRSHFSQRYPSAREALIAILALAQTALPTVLPTVSIEPKERFYAAPPTTPTPLHPTHDRPTVVVTSPKKGLSTIQWAAIAVGSTIAVGLAAFGLTKLTPLKSDPAALESNVSQSKNSSPATPTTPSQAPTVVATVTVTSTPTPIPTPPPIAPPKPPEIPAIVSLERVSFAEGSIAAVVRGSLAPNQKRQYVLNCGQGQQLNATIFQGQATVTLIAPNGAAIASGDNKLSARLPISGDYIIEVSAPAPTSFNLRIEVL
ncbi:serine/threonine-protein kinase [Tumidithrix helvetica PCC 7403]|uniref:protein kinase domain-containing protein n=1 Tax=Tumidithrix helvetica TaxID=3457545 RepID=UPI003CC49DD8